MLYCIEDETPQLDPPSKEHKSATCSTRTHAHMELVSYYGGHLDTYTA